MNSLRLRRLCAPISVVAFALACAPSAFAHAQLFPDSVPSGQGQLMQLTVPNEKENADTTEIRLIVPSGYGFAHVAPVPGWTTTVEGEEGAISAVTWKGKLSGEGIAVLPFTGTAKNARKYVFTIRQTYSDGSVVEWSGAEDSDTPASRIQATAGDGAEGGSDSTKTIAIIALVVGALGLLVAGAGLVAGRRQA